MSLPSHFRAFHVYRAQLLQEETLFPSSAGIDDRAEYLRSVLVSAMSQKRRPAGTSRWAVATPQIDETLEAKLFIAQLVHLKTRRRLLYQADTLSLEQDVMEDADTLTFVFDGSQEYFALQTSTQIDDKTALSKLRTIFNHADYFIRRGRLIEFLPVKSAEDALATLRKHRLAKFSAKLRKPNGEVDYALEELFKPLERGTNAEEVDVTWKSKAGQLKVEQGSAIWNAITMVSAAFGTWRAWPVKGDAGSPIVSDETPLTIRLNVATLETLVRTVRAAFARLNHFLSNFEWPSESILARGESMTLPDGMQKRLPPPETEG